MKTLKKSLFLCLLLLIILLFFAIPRAQPTTQLLKGPHGTVSITRDQNGIPHILTLQNDDDAFFALGYIHAEDRFWQMEFQRHIVQGTLSEMFGEKTIPQDKFLRTFGFYRAAQSAWPALDASTKEIVESYTAGVNAFLAEKKLPLQLILLRYHPKPWTNIDSIAWQKMMAFDLQNSYTHKIDNYLIAQHLGMNQIAVLNPSYPENAPTILNNTDLIQEKIKLSPISSDAALIKTLSHIREKTNDVRHTLNFDFAPGKGSNSWVVDGKHSTTGKPLLANDPHLALQAPNIWYLAELKGPHLHVTGNTIPGVPPVVIGHNDFIAWGETNVNPDTQDLYVENPGTPLKIIHEEIKVKGEDPIDFIVRVSPHGPIISDLTDAGKIGPLVALKWTALMPNDTTLQSMIELNYAHNWQDFVHAMRDFVVPSQNFIYADTAGNIGYYLPGLLPIRNGWNGALPVTDEHHEWAGFIPYAQLPHVYNPSSGYIVTANNKVTPDSYPYLINYQWIEPPYRAERILDLLRAKPKLSVNDFIAIQTDTKSYLWRDLKPYLLHAQPLDEKSKTALTILNNWNGKADLNSIGTTVFGFWYQELLKMPITKMGFGTAWKKPLFIKKQLANNGIYCREQNESTCDSYLSHTLQNAMNHLTNTLGDNPEQWQWKRLHHADFQELGFGTVKAIGWFWNRNIATPGSDYTVDVGTYNNDFVQTQGPGYRQIIDLSNMNNSLYIQSLGQSENPLSPHYRDFLKKWRNGEFILITSPFLPMQNHPQQ